MKTAHLCIVLPEVGMEGEGLRASQGISVPVTWEHTQNTCRVRTMEDIPAMSIWCSYSLGSGGEKYLCWDMRESFPLSSSRAGPYGIKQKTFTCCFNRTCLIFHGESPRMDRVRRRHFPGRLCCVDCPWAVAKLQRTFSFHIWVIRYICIKFRVGWGVETCVVWASPGWSTFAPSGCRSVVTLVITREAYPASEESTGR